MFHSPSCRTSRVPRVRCHDLFPFAYDLVFRQIASPPPPMTLGSEALQSCDRSAVGRRIEMAKASARARPRADKRGRGEVDPTASKERLNGVASRTSASFAAPLCGSARRQGESGRVPAGGSSIFPSHVSDLPYVLYVISSADTIAVRRSPVLGAPAMD